MDRLLQNFSIATNICPTPSNAADLLADGGTDLVVIDLEADRSSEFLRQIWESHVRQKPTVLAISTVDRLVPGVHVVLCKPVTLESGAKSLRAAYSRMVRDYRKHTRFAVMTPVVATDESDRIFEVTVTNIGEGGVGLTCKEKLQIGSVLSFRMRLPGLKNEISIQGRVLWNREYGAAGCEFARIPPFDIQLLHAWLESRYRIKKPLIPL
ncbi:MAG: PilZ domain-containing protein [Candidatus Sulfotelmatobacter sp.]